MPFKTDDSWILFDLYVPDSLVIWPDRCTEKHRTWRRDSRSLKNQQTSTVREPIAHRTILFLGVPILGLGEFGHDAYEVYLIIAFYRIFHLLPDYVIFGQRFKCKAVPSM